MAAQRHACTALFCRTGPPVIRPLSAQIFAFQKKWTQRTQRNAMHTRHSHPCPPCVIGDGMKDTDSAHIPLLQAA
jgi:hypothetical protein